MILYIIGITGVGKTTFGKALAKQLKYNFIDLDDHIVASQKKSIAALFEIGEQHFRSAESVALRSIDDSLNAVVATGGGVVTSDANIDYMRNSGFVIYVKRPIETIIATLDVTTRPLLGGDAERLYQLYEARQTRYQNAAHFTVDITSFELALDQTVEEISSENSRN